MTRRSASELEPKPAALLGQRVAFTGRFAALTRSQAATLVREAGGQFAPSVTPRTTMLVVGVRGWPLLESGRATRKLAAAERERAAGRAIRILSEDEFFEALGVARPSDVTPKSMDLEQVAATLGLPEATIVRWEQLGLVRSREGRYDFRDLVSLRTITDLVSRGVSPTVIRRSLEGLSRMLPGVERPLAQLRILVTESGQLAAGVDESLLTGSGQLEMNFGARPAAQSRAGPLPIDASGDAPEWIGAGLAHERAGDLDGAEAAYRRAAAASPADPVPHFNLGNVLLARGKAEAAAERFAQAVALDPSHAPAWFNLAYAQDAAGRLREASESLRRAAAADPSFADAYFNLADAAERLGEAEAAARAWREYLRLDPEGDWADEARRRLFVLRGRAWA